MINDKYACGELIQSWGLHRDGKRWQDLQETFTSDGVIAVSWFRGPFSGFVDQCRSRDSRAGTSRHLILPPVVRVAGTKALAETCVVILVRQDIEGVAVDLTSHARFVDRLEKHGARWRIAERNAIYERDRLDPVIPSAAFDRMMERADLSRYPSQYRYMAFRVDAAGRRLAEPVLCDAMPETTALLQRYENWLAEI